MSSDPDSRPAKKAGTTRPRPERTNTFLWAGLLTATVLALLWEFIPLKDASHRVRSLPASGAGYQSEDIPLTPTEAATFGSANVLKRLYRVGGQQFVVAVIDGTRNRHAVHDPFYCIRGSGWTIASDAPFAIEGGTGRLTRIVRGQEETEMLLWFSDGRTLHGSPVRYWWQTTLRRLSLGLSGPEPVLVIVQPAVAGNWNWRQFTEAFPTLFRL